MATNTRKLASLLGASGAGIANDGTLTSAAIGEVIVAGDIANDAVGTAELANDVAISTTGAIAGTGGLTIDGATVFNEASADVDFRIESNGNANTLFVDGGTDRVGIKTAVPTEDLHITGTDGSNSYLLIQNDASPESVQKFGYENNNGGFINLQNESGTDSVRFRSYGNSFTLNNFGIGTTSPENLLHIEGSGSVFAQIESSNNVDAGIKLIRSGTGNGDFAIFNEGGILTFSSGNDLGSAADATGTNRMFMKDDGKVGIGQSAPTFGLQVYENGSGTCQLKGNDQTVLEIITVGNSSAMIDCRLKNNDIGFRVESGGSSTGIISWKSGTLHNPSDERFKKNITDLEYGLDEINLMRGVRFKWKAERDPYANDPDDPRYQAIQVGFIAQELEAIAPELVNTCVSDDSKAIINNNYQLSAIMVNAIKELSAKNDALEAKVTTLETVQAEHETSILALEAA